MAASSTNGCWLTGSWSCNYISCRLAHHHGMIGDPELPTGNGVAIWFEVDDFDAVVSRIRGVEAEIVTDVHLNPNAGQREIWIRHPDGYLVVLAESSR